MLTRISRRRNEAVHPSPVDIAKIHSVVSGAIILAQISSQRREVSLGGDIHCEDVGTMLRFE